MTSEDMLRRAAECRLWAETAKEPEARATFAKAAETWETLARQYMAFAIGGGAPAAGATDKPSKPSATK